MIDRPDARSVPARCAIVPGRTGCAGITRRPPPTFTPGPPSTAPSC